MQNKIIDLMKNANDEHIFSTNFWLGLTNPYYKEDGGVLRKIMPIYNNPLKIYKNPYYTPRIEFENDELHELSNMSSEGLSVYLLGIKVSSENLQYINKNKIKMVLGYNSYIDLSSKDKLLAGYSKGHRSGFKKSLKYNLEIKYNDISNELFNAFGSGYEKNNIGKFGERGEFKIIEEIISSNRGFVISALYKNILISANVIIFDKIRAYNIMSYTNKSYSECNAQILTLHTAIEMSMAAGKIFDFEGSRIGPIAAFFNSFGAKTEPTYRMLLGNKLLTSLLLLKYA